MSFLWMICELAMHIFLTGLKYSWYLLSKIKKLRDCLVNFIKLSTSTLLIYTQTITNIYNPNKHMTAEEKNLKIVKQ
jgi:hypothetical protein